jgi:hypothetical protein
LWVDEVERRALRLPALSPGQQQLVSHPKEEITAVDPEMSGVDDCTPGFR